MKVDLGRLAVVRELRVQFQGGFAGRECELKAGGGAGEGGRVLMQFYPSDTNSLQVSQKNIWGTLLTPRLVVVNLPPLACTDGLFCM